MFICIIDEDFLFAVRWWISSLTIARQGFKAWRKKSHLFVGQFIKHRISRSKDRSTQKRWKMSRFLFGSCHSQWHLVVWWHPLFSSPWHYDDSEMERVVNEVSNMHGKICSIPTPHRCHHVVQPRFYEKSDEKKMNKLPFQKEFSAFFFRFEKDVFFHAKMKARLCITFWMCLLFTDAIVPDFCVKLHLNKWD